MVEATKEFFTKYATFKGRTTRKNFWFAVLGIFIISFLLGIVCGILQGITGSESITSIVTLIWELALIVPSIAIGVRRLHDINKSGWWYFISFVPFVGSIILLVFYCLPAVNEGNNY